MVSIFLTLVVAATQKQAADQHNPNPSANPQPLAQHAESHNPQIPGYIHGDNADSLKNWLRHNPQYRVADDSDYSYKDDLKYLSQYSDSPHPYYATGDFNQDGHLDFAVILIDLMKHPETAVRKVKEHADGSADYVFDVSQGFNTAIALFNGPKQRDVKPAFFDVQVGAISGSVIFYKKSVFFVGGFDKGGGRVLISTEKGYLWQWPGD
jgi:hypothetical protein